ncbi:peptidoglycan endopeptidase [Psychrobacillus glaciei]|uniref:Peptidoglycan endopeptidase n=1 Tax=Psychrobacillus glaciei TaxID=2283160 RepID=A0A5J6SJS4_9BACI|nr:C40 family peptidase [Psychrobacillus glaciei]QFF98195.1 peptidoglycan endopeptidase [Psychrobacillus glaciei]
MFKKVLLVTVLMFSFAATASASTNTLYEVKKGDSLSSIAKTYKITVNDLLTWNKLSKDSIFVKQKLIVLKPTIVKTSTKTPQTVVATKPVSPVKPQTVEKPVQVKAEELITSPGPLLDEAKPLSSNGQAIYSLSVDFAGRMQGIPYLNAGITMAGFDCSGFIYFVYTQAGLKISRQSSEGYFASSAPVTNPIVGDLVFFENTYGIGISHMGIYIGNNEFIHAGTKGVEKATLDLPYWKEHFVSFKRFHAVSVN